MDGNINGDMGPRPPVSMVTFTAKDRIEIVVEAEDDSHFYSGMVYPPAFGVPELVSRTSELRLLIHGAANYGRLFSLEPCACAWGLSDGFPGHMGRWRFSASVSAAARPGPCSR